jgi:hypothetical protein
VTSTAKVAHKRCRTATLIRQLANGTNDPLCRDVPVRDCGPSGPMPFVARRPALTLRTPPSAEQGFAFQGPQQRLTHCGTESFVRTGPVGFPRRPHRAGDETMVCPAALERVSAIPLNESSVRSVAAGFGVFRRTDRNFTTGSCGTKIADGALRMADAMAATTRNILYAKPTLPFLNVTGPSRGRPSPGKPRLRFPIRWPADGPVTPNRVSHGQQNAHRRIPPGRDPGSGATR